MQQKDLLILISVLIFFIIIGFVITINWFSPFCSSTTLGDIEAHFLNSLIFSNQLKEYKAIYPLSFSFSSLGYYHFSYSTVPYLIPILFNFFDNPRTSFLVFYILAYFLSGFFLFLFLKRNKRSVFSCLFFSTLLVFYGFMNQQFTVYGSFQTFLLVPLLLLTFIFLQKSTSKDPNKRDTLLFIFFLTLSLLIHFVGAIILFVFIIFYLLLTKNYRLFSYVFLSILFTSFYYVPLLSQSLLLSANSEGASSFFSIDFSYFFRTISFISQSVEGTGNTAQSDFFYGPFLFIGFIVCLIISYVKIDKDRLLINIKLERLDGILLSFVLAVFLVALMTSFIGVFRSNFPPDTVPFFFQLSFFLYVSFVLSKTNYKWELVVLLFILSLFSRSVFLVILFLLALVYFIIEAVYTKKFSLNKFHLSYLITIFLVLILLLPFTTFVDSSISYPRVWCTFFPNGMFFNTSLSMSDLVLFYDENFFVFTIPYLTGASVVNNIGHTTLLKDIPLYPDQELFEFISKAGVSKFMFTGLNREVNPSYFLNKTGVGSTHYFHRGLKTNLNYVDFDVEPVPYLITEVTPVELTVTLLDSLSDVSLRLFYHPWWRASSDSTEFNVTQDDWFVKVSGLDGVDSFSLRFDTTYFNLGSLVSVVALLVLLFLFYRY